MPFGVPPIFSLPLLRVRVYVRVREGLDISRKSLAGGGAGVRTRIACERIRDLGTRIAYVTAHTMEILQKNWGKNILACPRKLA